MSVPKPLEDFVKGTRELSVVIPDSDYQAGHNELVLVKEDIEVELPEPTEGTVVVIKTLTGSNVDVKAFPGTRVDGNTRRRFKEQYQSLSIISDGDNWETKERFGDPIEGVNLSDFILSNVTVNSGEPENNVTEFVVGQTLSVNAELFNGGVAGAENVELVLEELPDSPEDPAVQTVIDDTGKIALDANESTTISFSVPVDFQPDNYNLILRTPQDSYTQVFDVTAPPTSITVDNLQSPTDLTNAENITVSADITNDGQPVDNLDVELYADGILKDTQTISSLNYDETQNVSFNYTVDIRANSSNIEIAALDGSASVSVTVNYLSTFVFIENLGVDSSIERGRDTTITATANNLGPANTDVPIELILDQGETSEQLLDTQLIDPAEEGSQQVSFTYNAELELEDYTFTVSSPSSSATQSTTVVWATTEVLATNLQFPNPVNDGQTFEVSADLENIGQPDIEIPIRLAVGNKPNGDPIVVRNQKIQSLDYLETTTVTFTYTADILRNEPEIEVLTPSDSVSSTISIDFDDPLMNIRGLTAPSQIYPTEQFDVSVVADNLGPSLTGEDIGLVLDPGESTEQVLDTQTFDFNTEEDIDVTFTYAGDIAETGYVLGVRGSFNTATKNFRSKWPRTRFSVTGVGASTITWGEVITVSPTIENLGEPDTDIPIRVRRDFGESTIESPPDNTVIFDSIDELKIFDPVTKSYDVSFGTSRYKPNYDYDENEPIPITASVGVFAPEDSEEEEPRSTHFSFANFQITLGNSNITVSNLDTPTLIGTNEVYDINADLENIAEGELDNSVELRVSDDGGSTFTTLDSRSIDSPANQNINLGFDHRFIRTPGSYEFGIFTDDDFKTSTVEIEFSDTNGQVQNLDAPTYSFDGQSITVTADIFNVGQPATDVPVELFVDGASINERVIETQTISNLDYRDPTTVTFNWTTDLDLGEYTIGVRSPTDSSTQDFILPPTDVQIQSVNVQNPGFVESNLSADAQVYNSGEPDTGVLFELKIAGQGIVDSQTVDFGLRETKTVSFDYQLQNVGVTEGLIVTIIGPNNQLNQTIDVVDTRPEITDFPEVRNTYPGDTLNIPVDVRNQGKPSSNITVDYIIDEGTPEETNIGTETLSLNYLESGTATLSYNVGLTDGDYTITADTGFDSRTRNLTVNNTTALIDGGTFNAPQETYNGQSVTISADITNTGTPSASIPVELVLNSDTAGEQVLDTQNLNIGFEATVNASFTYTIAQSPGDYTYAIRTPDDIESRSIPVLATNAQLSNFSFPSVNEADTTMTISADVTNTGKPSSSIPVRGIVDGTQIGEQTLDLDKDETQNASFTFTLDPVGDVAEVSIETDDDSVEGITLVQFNDFFVLVDNLNAPLAATPDDTIDISAELENIGEDGFGIGIELIFDEGGAEENVVRSEDIVMDADETRLQEYTVDVSELYTSEVFGEFTIGIFSPNGSATQTFTVQSPGLAVNNLEAPDFVDQNEDFTVTADITNNGGDELGAPVRVVRDRDTANSEILASQSIDITADETQTLNFTANIDEEPARYNVGVYTRDDGQSKQISVSEPTVNFDVTVTDGTVIQSNFEPTIESESVPTFFGITADNIQEASPNFDVTVTEGQLLTSNFEPTIQSETVPTFFGVTADSLSEVNTNYEATITNTSVERVEVSITNTTVTQ